MPMRFRWPKAAWMPTVRPPEPDGGRAWDGPRRSVPAVEPQPRNSLAGRTALVTGASRGIGAAVARALDAAGARVALAARDRPALEAVAAELANAPVVLATDLSSAEAPADLAARAVTALGGVDVLVNNAAVAARLPTVDVDAELVDQLYAVNVRAPLLLTAALVPSLGEHGAGRS
jgi:NAD(P)-dependent dehydrogenase (short-subunit alcohol dehydrogenase family)